MGGHGRGGGMEKGSYDKRTSKNPDGNLLMYKLPKMHKCTYIKGAVVL